MLGTSISPQGFDRQHSLGGLFHGRCVCTGDGGGGEQSGEKSPLDGGGLPMVSPSPHPSSLGKNAIQVPLPCTQTGLYPALLRAGLWRGCALSGP